MRNSWIWRNTQNFSTTSISPKKAYLTVLALEKYLKHLLKYIIWYIIRIKVAFLEIPAIPRFRFDSIAQNENAEAAEIFRFLINSRDFCQTQRSDTILILET